MTFEELERYKNNPSRIINKVFSDIENGYLKSHGGLHGTSDPFTYSVDLITGMGCAVINTLEDNLYKDYKEHATSLSDLSKHMSDEDWNGIFASPSQTTIRFIISEDEIKKKAIQFEVMDGEILNQYKKLVIPKDTLVQIVDTSFWLEHAVEFRVMLHGGIQVLYDTTQPSPFSVLTSNYPEKETLVLGGRRFISVKLPVKQIDIKEIPNKSSNETVGLSLTESYNDRLYGIRAFITNNNGTRREMKVIYNRDVYDPNYPTLVIDLLMGNQFTASIPSVYIENKLGIGFVTLLVYTTKGVYERDLTSINNTYHKLNYFNFDNSKGVLNTYEQPFTNIDDVLVDSYTPITGGSNGKSFNEIKNAIVYQHRRRDLPVSDIDLDQTFQFAGYRSIKAIDYPNYRLYRLTSDLPAQDNKSYDSEEIVRYNSAMGVYFGSYLTSINELVNDGVGFDNGRRFTMTPGQVFDISQPSVRLFPQVERERLLNASRQVKIDTMVEKTLVGNPFYYVIDTTRNQAHIRSYLLNYPSIVEQTFFYENPYLGITLGLDKNSVSIVNTGNSFIIDIVTTSDEAYKKLDDDKVGIQLMFTGDSEFGNKTLRGELVGKNKDGERKWRFVLETRFDIDDSNLISFKNFYQYGGFKEDVWVDLFVKGNFIFTIESEQETLRSVADKRINPNLFDKKQIAIIETEFNIEFGRHLDKLYTTIRPMIGAEQYEVYEDNVYATYLENTFKQNPDGSYVIVDGGFVIDKRKGDFILDDKGNKIIINMKGETKYDQDNKPILKEPRQLRYFWDFIGFDYNYYLSEDQYDLDYLERVIKHLGITIMDEVEEFNRITNEQTVIKYKPTSTMGYTDVIINQEVRTQTKNDFKFSVIYYLTESGHQDMALRKSLITSTHTVINETLKRNTVSVSDIVGNLKPNNTDSQIVEIKLLAWTGRNGIDVVTNVDNTNGFSVSKTIDLTADKFLSIKEDIDIAFLRHISS